MKTNEKGEVEILILVIGIIVVFVAYFLWNAGTESNRQHCKVKYGQEYNLGSSRANSSVQWCVSPDGVMKEL